MKIRGLNFGSSALALTCFLTVGTSPSFANADQAIDTRTLSEVGVIPKLEAGDTFIWGYYPGAGTAPRMYEAYVKLAPAEGKPSFALITLFPDEAPAGVWVLHDGVGFDYDQIMSAYADPKQSGTAVEQMFGWNSSEKKWFASTSRPNTSANQEKFNYRNAVSHDGEWVTDFGCYEGTKVTPVDPSSGTCAAGEIVFRHTTRNKPSYVFLPYYSLATQVTAYKLFNEESSDPDAHVAMRLVYAKDARGQHKIQGEDPLVAKFLPSLELIVAEILESGKN